MNSREYIDWIKQQSSSRYTVVQTEPDRLELRNDQVTGFVNVYHLDTEIVELRLERNEDNESLFFLHFELKDEDHARSLFKEMTDVIENYRERRDTKVLLSCTSGFTTSFFAEKLKDAASALSLDMTFLAVPFSELYETADDYDVILLAPQIAYEYKKISEIYPNKIVMKIPAQIFASYDAGKMCTEIAKAVHEKKLTKEYKAAYHVMRDITLNACIFVINMTADLDRARFVYRLYDKGETVFSEEVIKCKNSFQDVIDILDTEFTAFRKNYEIDAVSIAIPGILPGSHGSDYIDYEAASEGLTELYGLPVFVQHNTVAVAYGFYAGQTKYDNVTYHSQPKGGLVGGQGMVCRGVPIIGSHQRAGEIAPVFTRFHPGVPFKPDNLKPSQVLQTIVSYLLVNIAVYDPDVILVRSLLTPDMEELKKELSQYIDEKKLPDLIYTDDIGEYACLGSMLYAMRMLKDQVFRIIQNH